MAFEIKQNDRRPYWRVMLTENGDAANITGAVGAVFTMKDATSGTLKINKEAMTVIEEVSGTVEYVWQAGDTDTAGTYSAEVEVDWGGGETQTFPSHGYFLITIYDDLA